MEVIKRAIAILDALSHNSQGMKFSEIADAMRISGPSTLSRMLQSLCCYAAVKKSHDGIYTLTPKVVQWGQNITPKLSLQQVVKPSMERITKKLKVSTIVFEHTGNAMRCIEKISDELSPSLQTPGVILSVCIKLIGSYWIMSENQKYEDNYAGDFEDSQAYKYLLKTFAEDAQKDGCVYDYGKNFPDNNRLSVPIHFNGKTIAILGAGFTPGRLKEKGFRKRLTAELLTAAEEVSYIISEQDDV
ncbi:MAG: helix-turn-helix domain-containing protein [Lentisphaerae bacterium]|nr:helix-turn-helix domain-containing protein [Lentisphaerota bacterium]MCP4102827.1 helix-turn-helix domain-containing protein [Lentisphaerota bacterium]